MKKVRISLSDLAALQDAFIWKLQQFKHPQPGYTAYNYLLQEHCADFCRFLEQIGYRGSKYYNINFSSLQALAFNQLWINQPVPIPSSTIILQLIAAFDQASKKPKTIEV